MTYDDKVTIIDADEWEEAIRNPKQEWVEMQLKAKEYADHLVANGHCCCHLVINCPDEDGGASS